MISAGCEKTCPQQVVRAQRSAEKLPLCANVPTLEPSCLEPPCWLNSNLYLGHRDSLTARVAIDSDASFKLKFHSWHGRCTITRDDVVDGC
ncbi:hypothetical protein PM082_022800 [Marasmius tenuissimus]|nr:hypothetical protein PM082_022800 [Marasmius tenuissimus]